MESILAVNAFSKNLKQKKELLLLRISKEDKFLSGQPRRCILQGKA
jgi:hypothetical protein